MPLVLGFAFAIVIVPFLRIDPNMPLLEQQMNIPLTIVSYLVGFASIWFGAYYSVRYVLKRYDIHAPREVVRLSTVYFAAIMLPMEVINEFFILTSRDVPTSLAVTNAAIGFSSVLISIGIFYFASMQEMRRR